MNFSIDCVGNFWRLYVNGKPIRFGSKYMPKNKQGKAFKSTRWNRFPPRTCTDIKWYLTTPTGVLIFSSYQEAANLIEEIAKEHNPDYGKE